MPRRFALGLIGLLVLLLAVLFVARRVAAPVAGRPGETRQVSALPTPVVPPTPIPGRRVSLFFEPKEGELFRAEMREIPAATDDVAFLRTLAAAVLDGTRIVSVRSRKGGPCGARTGCGADSSSWTSRPPLW